jgi:uncharacterized C2H2 Zn-finger protein
LFKTPDSHINNGCGCPKCGVEISQKNKIENKGDVFIKRANEVHNNFYNYSKTNYTGADRKVIIICPEHGEFKQQSSVHLIGCGCPQCGGAIKHTLNDFIQKANKIHNNKYDYSKVNYINSKTKVIIICPEHGEFSQIPSSHLNGCSCLKCGIIKASTSKRYSSEKFIKKAIKIHENFYDYSKIVYIDSQTKIIIICPEHGEFEQTPSGHLSGRGCPICANNKKGQTLIYTTKEYIQKVNKIHKNFYNYSKVKYVRSDKKIIIICPEHGEFLQKPVDHLLGKGCQKCAGIYKPSTEEYIQKANEVHNYEYDYSKVKYLDAKSKIIIICTEHGEFEQEASSHLGGAGCPICGGNKILNLMPYEKLKILVRSLDIKRQRQYIEWWRKNEEYCRKNGIPACPYKVYNK